jgi:DNA modification methylase
MGSGTTAKMAILNNRNWIGSEISSEYCNIIEERVKKAWGEKRKEKDLTQNSLFGDGM